jgi:hypothetical protein
LTVWNGYRAIVQEGKSDVRRLVPEVNTSGTSANGDTNCGILEQYQRHIKIESIMGNADVALSLLARSCKFLWASCTFGLSQTAKDGYKFGYRHQFGLITLNYAKLLKDRHLWESNITLNYAYLFIRLPIERGTAYQSVSDDDHGAVRAGSAGHRVHSPADANTKTAKHPMLLRRFRRLSTMMRKEKNPWR